MRAVECEVCKGAGQYEQTYTIGCGFGSHQSMGKCTWCDGVGYVDSYDKKPAAAKHVAELLRAEIAALRVAGSKSAPADPMDWPLPCDVTVGAGTNKKGTKLRTLVTRMKMLHGVAMRVFAAPAGEPVAMLAKGEIYTLRRLIECAEELNKRPRPICRDCADEDGTCPTSKLECDMRKLFADAKALHNKLAAPVANAGQAQAMAVPDGLEAAFEKEMAGRHYGGVERQDAYEWFGAGFKAAPLPQQVAPDPVCCNHNCNQGRDCPVRKNATSTIDGSGD